MLLKNRFKDIDKQRVWLDHQFCALCYSNQQCSLHHIKSTESDSILNSIMLCFKCHKFADTRNVSDKEFMSKCLKYTIKQVLQTNYTLTEKDTDFYNNNKALYN